MQGKLYNVVFVGHGFQLTERRSLFPIHHNNSTEDATDGNVSQDGFFTFGFYQVCQ